MLNVAVVGATGAVGQEMISAIFELGLPVDDLILASSERSAGRVVSTPRGDIEVREATPELFDGVDVAFFAAGGSVSLELAPQAARRGALVIDNSSAFRMDPDAPCRSGGQYRGGPQPQGIIANPNCSTIIAIVRWRLSTGGGGWSG